MKNESEVVNNSKYDYFWNKKIIVSFILSIMVVMIHASSFYQYFRNSSVEMYPVINFINLFFRRILPLVAVPLFFVISGATFFRNYESSEYFRKIKGRVKSLVIPYLIWNTIWMVFSIIISNTFISNYMIGRQKFIITPKNVFLSVFHHMCNGPFWFIFALIFFLLITPLIDKVMKNKIAGISVIGIITILLFFDIGIPKWFVLEPNSIIFYLIGCYIGKHYFSYFAKKNDTKKCVIMCIFFVLGISFITLTVYDILPDIYAVKTIVLMICALSLWVLFDLFVEHIPLKNYYKDSFLIYAMHFNVQSIIIKIIYLFMPKTVYMSVVNFVISTIFTVLFILIFANFLKKYLKGTYSVLSGSR